MNEDRIIEIESVLAHHEQQIAEMSDVITDQWKMIDALKIKLEKALGKIEQIEFNRTDSHETVDSIERARRDIPPHY